MSRVQFPPYPFPDVLPGNFGLDRFLCIHAVRRDGINPGKPCSGQDVFVVHPSGDQPDRYTVCQRSLQDTFRKFAHQCLSVGMSFAGNDQVNPLQCLIKPDEIERQVCS